MDGKEHCLICSLLVSPRGDQAPSDYLCSQCVMRLCFVDDLHRFEGLCPECSDMHSCTTNTANQSSIKSQSLHHHVRHSQPPQESIRLFLQTGPRGSIHQYSTGQSVFQRTTHSRMFVRRQALWCIWMGGTCVHADNRWTVGGVPVPPTGPIRRGHSVQATNQGQSVDQHLLHTGIIIGKRAVHARSGRRYPPEHTSPVGQWTCSRADLLSLVQAFVEIPTWVPHTICRWVRPAASVFSETQSIHSTPLARQMKGMVVLY